MVQNDDISISEAAEILNISEDTLRRWDKEGKLVPIRSAGGQRIYSRTQLEIFRDNLFISAQDWVLGLTKISDQIYC
jgi:DNA (cytosine-5)-methyltransferase 1